MPVAELVVRRSDDAGTLTFTFPDGPRQAMAIAMVEEETGQPVWLLTTDAFTTMLPYTVESVEPGILPSADDEIALENELLARGVDSAALEAGRKANRTLETIQYGSVPVGFRQVMPSGAPQPLQQGRRYCVTVVGGIGVPLGQASFTA